MGKKKSMIIVYIIEMPIGFFCELIDLGGAEFRISVLPGEFKVTIC